MKQVCITIVIATFFFTQAIAQQKDRIRFSGIMQFGVLKGKTDQTWQLQSINGIKYKTWFAGIGIGLEDYYFKTIPVFVDLRRNLFINKATPFVYADLGFSLPFKGKDKEGWQRSEFKKGMYYDFGVGYNVPLKGSLSFDVSAGYSLKELHEARYYRVYRDFPPYDTDDWLKDADYDFSFRRISFKAALRF